MTFREQIIEQARGYYDINTGRMQGVEFSVSPESAATLVDPLPNGSFVLVTPVGPVRIRVDTNLQPGMIRAERLSNAVTTRAPAPVEPL